MTKYYFRIKSKDRIGNVNFGYYIDEAKNKTALRKRHNREGHRIDAIYTEEELETKVVEGWRDKFRNGLNYTL